MDFREYPRTAIPAQTTGILGKKGFLKGWLSRNFLYSTMSFLSDAHLAQLDRALDYELLQGPRLSLRHSSVFSGLGTPSCGQEVPPGRNPGANGVVLVNGYLSYRLAGDLLTPHPGSRLFS